MLMSRCKKMGWEIFLKPSGKYILPRSSSLWHHPPGPKYVSTISLFLHICELYSFPYTHLDITTFVSFLSILPLLLPLSTFPVYKQCSSKTTESLFLQVLYYPFLSIICYKTGLFCNWISLFRTIERSDDGGHVRDFTFQAFIPILISSCYTEVTGDMKIES